MNSPANATSVASNGSSCASPGYGIAPPALPIYQDWTSGSITNWLELEPNGTIYALSSPDRIGNDLGQTIYYADGYFTLSQSHDALNSYTGTPIIHPIETDNTTVGPAYLYVVTGVKINPGDLGYPDVSAFSPLGTDNGN